jgi:hypothetical protein
LVRKKAFDAETTAVLIAAYEKAIVEIEHKSLPNIMREVAARRIIALAAKGERDPDHLCASALGTIARVNARPVARVPLPAIADPPPDRAAT